MIAPTIGPTIQIQKLSKLPSTIAGPRYLAGFIAAPETPPPIKMSMADLNSNCQSGNCFHRSRINGRAVDDEHQEEGHHDFGNQRIRVVETDLGHHQC